MTDFQKQETTQDFARLPRPSMVLFILKPTKVLDPIIFIPKSWHNLRYCPFLENTKNIKSSIGFAKRSIFAFTTSLKTPHTHTTSPNALKSKDALIILKQLPL